jgi:hypothetical protein
MTLRGRRPGDQRVRIERVRPQAYDVAPRRRIRRPLSPSAVLVLGFAILVAIGTVLLALPMSTQPGRTTDIVTALFTATSAVCVNGLVVVDTGTHWSPFGTVVVIALVQIGGFGFMTGSTLLLFLLVRRSRSSGGSRSSRCWPRGLERQSCSARSSPTARASGRRPGGASSTRSPRSTTPGSI